MKQVRNGGLSWPRAIVGATALLLAAAVPCQLVWARSGDFAWLRFYFDYPASLFLVGMAALGCVLCWRAWQEFSPGDMLRPAWLLIALAALCQCAGYALAHWLAVPTRLDPLGGWLSAAAGRAAALRQAGLEISGTLAMLFLAAGLAVVVAGYRRAGMWRRLVASEWAACGLVAAYAARVIYVVAVTQARTQAPISFGGVLDWLNDPLLALLVAEALLLRRGVLAMRWGLIGRCWGALALAVLLTAGGSALHWAVDFGWIRWPWSSLTWYIWYPAAAAYALCPAYQLRAAQLARLRLAEYRTARGTA